jgi:phosphatidylinositol alpha-1,6-mannosyltransferase
VTRRLFARGMRQARAVVCVSRYTRARVADVLPLDNLEVINNGLEPPNRSNGRDGEPIAGDPVLLGVGAVKPRKGYHVAIEALTAVRERHPDVHYYVVGDDQDRKYVGQLRETVDRLNLGGNVTITGIIDDSRLDALYRRCDAFILPSVNSGGAFEGYGLAYLEANAYGKPVVGSLDCGAEDAIRHGENGYLTPQNDPSALASYVLNLLDDAESAARMGERGRQFALGRDWSRVTDEYLVLYERAVGR